MNKSVRISARIAFHHRVSTVILDSCDRSRLAVAVRCCATRAIRWISRIHLRVHVRVRNAHDRSVPGCVFVSSGSGQSR